MITVSVEGLEPIIRTLRRYPSDLDGVLRPALKDGGAVLFGAQRKRVHKVTRKLAQSIGMTEHGRGAGVEVHIGLQPGLGTPRAEIIPGTRPAGARHYTKSQTAHWKQPRDGWNIGDPREYGPYEEARHPFFLNTFVEKQGDIESAVLARASQELQKRLRT